MRNIDRRHAFFLKDPKLGDAARRLGPARLDIYGRGGPFLALAEAVISQQLSGKAASALFAKLEGFIGKRRPPEKALAAASPGDLRELGISEAKSECLVFLARETLSGGLDLAALSGMSDKEVEERLTSIKGIGPWTAHMFLIFGLKREDVWPSTDYGIRKNLTALMRKKELLSPGEADKIGGRWRPYRSYAAWYIWNG